MTDQNIAATLQVTGTLSGAAVIEDAPAFALYTRSELFGIASDSDPTAVLDLVFDPQTLPPGVVYNHEAGYTIAQHAVTGYYGAVTIVPEQIVAPVDTLSLDPANAAYQSLAPGEELDVVVNYSITDGTQSATAQAVFQVFGSYDAPVSAGPVTVAAIEDGAAMTADATAGAIAIDHGTVLSVVAPPPPPVEANFSAAGINETPLPPPPILPFDASTLPAGVTFDAATNSFSIDASNAAYQSLAQGATRQVVVQYGVTDGISVVAASTVFTVTGTNDAPIVDAPISGMILNEDGGVRTIGSTALMAFAHDIDTGDKLSLVIDNANLPAGVTYTETPAQFMPSHYVPAQFIPAGPRATPWGNYVYPLEVIPAHIAPAQEIPASSQFSIDPSDPAYQSLAQGEELTVTIDYAITDGIASTPSQVVLTINGMNDAPVIGGISAAAATEDGAAVTVSGLDYATDADHGAVLSIVAAPLPAVLPIGTLLRDASDIEAEQQAANAIAAANAAQTPLDLATLPAGVSFDAASNSFTLDPSNAAYQYLSAGQTLDVAVNYGVSDGIAATAAAVVFTVTGTNDAPVATGILSGVSVTEDGSGGVYDHAALISNISDPDLADTLTLQVDQQSLPAGVIYNDTPGQLTTITTQFTYYGVIETITSTALTIDTLTIDPSDPAYQSLAAGETLDVTANYSVTDGTSAAPAQAVFHITGVNDAPVVSAAVQAAATEDGAAVTASGLANAADVDHGAVLSVVAAPVPQLAAELNLSNRGINETAAAPPPPIMAFDPLVLPAGVSFDAASNSFTLDPSNPAYQFLSAGQTLPVTVDYGVSDGIANTAASLTFVVTGTNDAPTVDAPVAGLVVNEDAAIASYDLPALLAHAHDTDINDKLTVSVNLGSLPAGVSDVSTPETLIPGHTIPAVFIPAGPRGTSWGGYVYPATIIPAVVVPDQIVPATSLLSIDPSDAAYQSLAQGEELSVTVDYTISDGTASVPAQAIFVVNGMNDAPAVSAPVTGAAIEDGAPVTLSGIANASDIDHGTILSITAAPIAVVPAAAGLLGEGEAEATQQLAAATASATASLTPFDPATLPPGVTFDAASNSFTLDPANAAYQSLAQGQVQTVTVQYGVSDGIAATAASLSFTVTGTNDAPVVTGPQTLAIVAGTPLLAFNPLANASDADQGTVLSVAGALPSWLLQTAGGYSINPNTPAFQALAAGETTTQVWNYGITDGIVTVPATASVTVTGINDAPVAPALVLAVTEGGAVAKAAALAGASDPDHGAVLSAVNIPAVLPAGVSYNAATGSFAFDPTLPAFQALAQGQVATYSVAYGISDGSLTTPRTALFNITGVNNAPVVVAPITGTANEDGALSNIEPLLSVTDIDSPADALKIVNMPANLPAGISFAAGTHRFVLDPSNAAYQSLSLGETKTVSIPFAITDGYATVPASATYTITGTNDAPVVAGAVNGGTVTAKAVPVALNLLASASDIDHLDVLNVNLLGNNKVTASVTAGVWTAPVAFSVVNNQLSIDPAQFASLGIGKTVGLTFNYQVSDGNPGGSVPASATLAVQGSYAGPTGVTMADATGSLAKAQSGTAINAKTAVATFTQTGGIAADSYSYALSGSGAAAFTIASSGGVGTLSSASGGAAGAAGGQLYALGVTVTDTTAGIAAPVAALDVVVGSGKGANTINLGALAGLVPSTPTFVYDLGGADSVNGAAMTSRLWLDGGQGADTMTGGSGANTYLYAATTDSTVSAMDIIANFHAASDLLDFVGLGAKFGTVAALAGSATSIGGNSIGWQASGGNTFIYANTTGNSQALGSASMKIELQGSVPLTFGNFAHL